MIGNIYRGKSFKLNIIRGGENSEKSINGSIAGSFHDDSGNACVCVLAI
jgi:hypothetical protein